MDEIRIYVSAATGALDAERELLSDVVLPRLRERGAAAGRGIAWELVDPEARAATWGLKDRLRAIDGSPVFVAFVGERLGPPLPPPQADLVRSYPWLADLAGASLGEVELAHGALVALEPWEARRSFLYLRAPDLAVPPRERLRFRAATREEAARLEQLKASLRASGRPLLDGYPCRWDAAARRVVGLEALADRLVDDLWSVADGETAARAPRPAPLPRAQRPAPEPPAPAAPSAPPSPPPSAASARPPAAPPAGREPAPGETAAAKTAASEIAAPKTAATEVAAAESAASELAGSETAAPAIAASETAASEVAVLETTASEIAASETTASEMPAPEIVGGDDIPPMPPRTEGEPDLAAPVDEAALAERTGEPPLPPAPNPLVSSLPPLRGSGPPFRSAGSGRFLVVLFFLLALAALVAWLLLRP